MSSPSFYARLVAGVRLSVIYQNVGEEVEVTRYKEDTGEPYMKNVKKRYVVFLGKQWSLEEFEKQDVEKHVNSATGLVLYGSGNDEFGEQVVGELIAFVSTDDWRTSNPLSVVSASLIDHSMQVAEKKLTGCGCAVKPELFLVSCVIW